MIRCLSECFGRIEFFLKLRFVWVWSAITIRAFAACSNRQALHLKIEILLKKQTLCILTQSANSVNTIYCASVFESGREDLLFNGRTGRPSSSSSSREFNLKTKHGHHANVQQRQDPQRLPSHSNRWTLKEFDNCYLCKFVTNVVQETEFQSNNNAAGSLSGKNREMFPVLPKATDFRL